MEELTAIEVIKIYTELGVLALIAITFVLIAVYVIRNSSRHHDNERIRVDTRDNELMEGYKDLLKATQEQNNKLIETMQNNNKDMLKQLVNKIVHHTISPEESAQQSVIDKQLKDTIIRIRKETKSQRASIVKYHNGGRGINGQPFLKMSMTNEDIVAGVTPLMGDFKEQFRNLLGSFVSIIDSEEKCFIQTREELKEKDASMYEFMALRNINTLYGVSIKDNNGYPIGFVCLEFDNSNINIEKIDNLMEEDLDNIKILMNKKIVTNS